MSKIMGYIMAQEEARPAPHEDADWADLCAVHPVLPDFQEPKTSDKTANKAKKKLKPPIWAKKWWRM